MQLARFSVVIVVLLLLGTCVGNSYGQETSFGLPMNLKPVLPNPKAVIKPAVVIRDRILQPSPGVSLSPIKPSDACTCKWRCRLNECQVGRCSPVGTPYIHRTCCHITSSRCRTVSYSSGLGSGYSSRSGSTSSLSSIGSSSYGASFTPYKLYEDEKQDKVRVQRDFEQCEELREAKVELEKQMKKQEASPLADTNDKQNMEQLKEDNKNCAKKMDSSDSDSESEPELEPPPEPKPKKKKRKSRKQRDREQQDRKGGSGGSDKKEERKSSK